MLPDPFIPPSLAPIDLDDDVAFVPARQARLALNPARAVVSRVSVSELPRRQARTLFAHPDYLASHGVTKVLQVRFDGHEQGPMIFIPRGNHAVYAERTNVLDAELGLAAAQALLRHFALDHVLYDSVQWQGQPRGETPFFLRFHFQNDWVMPRQPLDEKGRMPRGIRQKWSRLQRDHGVDNVEFTLEAKPERSLFDQILAWNAAQVEAHGHRFGLSAQDREMLWDATCKTGMIARLRIDGKDVAGCIIGICAGEAWLMVLGYDPAFSRASPGVLVMALARRELAGLDVHVVHLLWGDKRHKHDAGAIWTPLHSVLVPRSPLTLMKPAVAGVVFRHLWLAAKTALRYRLDPRPGVGR